MEKMNVNTLEQLERELLVATEVYLEDINRESNDPSLCTSARCCRSTVTRTTSHLKKMVLGL